MQPAPPQGGSRISPFLVAGLVILGVLLGCIFGAFLGGAGGFLTGRTLESRNAVGLQNQVSDLQRQLSAAQTRPAPTQAAPAGAATARPPTGAPALPATPTRSAQGGQGATPQATTRPPAAPGVYLGVRYNILNPDIAAQVGITLTNGALIGEVVPASPAEKAGLLPDDVITAVDGKELNESYTLADAVATKKPGDQLAMKVFRDGKFQDVTAQLVAPPAGAFNTPTPGAVPPGGATPRPGGGTTQPGQAATPTPQRPPSGATATPQRPPSGATAAPSPRTPAATPGATARPGGAVIPPNTVPATTTTSPRAYLGVMVSPVTADIAKANSLPQVTGAVIEQVMPSSPAFMAGLFDEDIILTVDGAPVDANHSLTALLANHKPGDSIKLHVIRNGKPEDLTITLTGTTREFEEGKPGGP